MITEKIRIIEVRKCGECPRFRISEFVMHGTNESEIHPDCPLREIEIMKQSVIDNWKKVCEMYPGTGYDPEMISGPKPSNSME